MTVVECTRALPQKSYTQSIDSTISVFGQMDCFLDYSTQFPIRSSCLSSQLLFFYPSYQVFSTLGYTLPLCAVTIDSSLAGARNPAKPTFSSCHSWS